MGRRRRETSKKGNIIAIVTVLCVAGLILLLTKIQSPDAYGTCTVGVRCTEVLSHLSELAAGKEDYLPSEGVFLADERVGIYQGDSALAVLERALQTAGVPLQSEEDTLLGVSELCAGDCGAGSCWKLRVNGAEVSVPESGYLVQPDDVLEFYFSCG